MKSTKNFVQLFIASLISFAIGPLSFADAAAGDGGGTEQNTEGEAEGYTPVYSFENPLRSLIMSEIKASDVVTLDDDAVDHEGEMNAANPVYALAETITQRFSLWLKENGIPAETFNQLPGFIVEGEVVETKELTAGSAE